MRERDFDYSSIEVICSDLKIVFITDEKTEATGHTNIHMHSFFELFYLTEGTLTLRTDKDEITLEKDEMLIIPPNAYHSTESREGTEKRSVFFTFCKIKSQEKEKLYDKVSAIFAQGGFFKMADCRYIATLFGKILETGASEHTGAEYRRRAYVTELIFSIFDRIESETQSVADGTHATNTYWVYKYAIERLLDTYYNNDITLEFLSEKLFLSPQNVTRIISAAYGKSFNELKSELKMRNAKRMLLETDLSVNEIGERIGYSSARGFFAAFRKYEGCTPSEYRKENKK